MNDAGLANIFEERAEYLSQEDLLAWTEHASKDSAVLGKLTGPGPKLISGPRGSGKSTYFRVAYFSMLKDGNALPIYVNYAKSLALEPLFHSHANALALFRQWVLAKILVAVPEIVREKAFDDGLERRIQAAEHLIRQLEAGIAPDYLADPVTPSDLSNSLEAWAHLVDRRRVVLLLDDAAHAFSPEQQREFFEIFRELRSRVIAPKAAVYPGITSYTPTFHVGHDAELVEAWMRPDDEDFLSTMRRIAERRLPTSMLMGFEGREELLDLVALASFGLPRGFLTMLSSMFGVEESEGGFRRPTKARADKAISDYASNTKAVFRALSAKLPRYRNFVSLGVELQASIVGWLQNYNRTRSGKQARATAMGLREPIEEELKRIISLLEYAGIVRGIGSHSRGAKGSFERYWIHYSLLLSGNALALGRRPSTATTIEALVDKDPHVLPRSFGTQLLGDDFRSRCTLNLPPCAKCGEPRATPEARYCLRCGERLTEASVFKELLQANIGNLPLTKRRIESILESTSLRTVQDVLLDEEMTQLRSVPYIGPIWATTIRRAAEEFVYV